MIRDDQQSEHNQPRLFPDDEMDKLQTDQFWEFLAIDNTDEGWDDPGANETPRGNSKE